MWKVSETGDDSIFYDGGSKRGGERGYRRVTTGLTTATRSSISYKQYD